MAREKLSLPFEKMDLTFYLHGAGNASSFTSLLSNSSSSALIYPRSRGLMDGNDGAAERPGRSGIVPHPRIDRVTKETSSSGPRGQYTGWRMAAIRGNETVGKCILAGYALSDVARAMICLLPLSLSFSLPFSLFSLLSFPSSTFHPALCLSRLNSRVLIISLCCAFHVRFVIYATYSGRVCTRRIATRP
jgi:hypothetical protein